MFTIALISAKGSMGKSTIAENLAALAAKVGQAVAIIDIDPQTSAMNWKDRRKADTPTVICVPASRLGQALQAARDNGADLAIIDAPGKNDGASIDAARVADLVLIPTSADPVVMETMPAVRTIMRAAGDPPAFVIFNFIHPSGSRIADALKEHTPAYTGGLPACPIHLSDLKAYAMAPASGQAVHEYEPRSPAAAEMEKLYLWISEHVNMSQRTKVDGTRKHA